MSNIEIARYNRGAASRMPPRASTNSRVVFLHLTCKSDKNISRACKPVLFAGAFECHNSRFSSNRHYVNNIVFDFQIDTDQNLTKLGISFHCNIAQYYAALYS